MSGRDDGGPAFPNITPDMPIQGGPGMSLRDYLAGQAPITLADAQVIMGATFDVNNDKDRAAIMLVLALMRYEYADAMIAERAK